MTSRSLEKQANRGSLMSRDCQSTDVLHQPELHGGRLDGKLCVTVTQRRIVIFTPGGMEDFFFEIEAAAEGMEVDRAAALAAATRHGWRFLTSEDDTARRR